jgi:hypothetical protein
MDQNEVREVYETPVVVDLGDATELTQGVCTACPV